MTRVVVVGGGITGLVAAREAAIAGAEVSLLDPAALGGKVRSSGFDGGRLDEAADAFLARAPEGVELCRDLGLEGELVAPAQRRAYVWSRGDLRLLPKGHVLGVPTDLDELAGAAILSPEGMARVRAELTLRWEPAAGDSSIGELMRARLGDEAAERLVDPLVGGINAGDTDRLSLKATVPQLDSIVRAVESSLIEACRAQREAATGAATPGVESTSNRPLPPPVFLAPRKGMGALVDALVDDVAERGVELLAAPATGLQQVGQVWRVQHAGGSPLAADAVVIATPAPVAATLVEPHAGGAAELLHSIPYASVALISLAVPLQAVDRELDASGFLVPRAERRTVTACSWTSAKWPHLAGDGTVWLRASVGRDGADAALALPDRELVETVLVDLADMMALHGAPTETRVTRWPRSFPQYRPGHLDRVASIESELEKLTAPLVVAGAAMRGLGVPACIRQGRAAARAAVERSHSNAF